MAAKRKLRTLPKRKERPEAGYIGDHPPGTCDQCDEAYFLWAGLRRAAWSAKRGATRRDFDPLSRR